MSSYLIMEESLRSSLMYPVSGMRTRNCFHRKKAVGKRPVG